jgi:hypothetical protein
MNRTEWIVLVTLVALLMTPTIASEVRWRMNRRAERKLRPLYRVDDKRRGE